MKDEETSRRLSAGGFGGGEGGIRTLEGIAPLAV